MGEAPTSALRHKKRSSMRKAIELVQAKEAHACVSAGNTGALLTLSFYLLKTLSGIDRFNICFPLFVILLIQAPLEMLNQPRYLKTKFY